MVVTNIRIVRIPRFIRRFLICELFFLEHIAQRCIVRMAKTILPVHRQLIIEILSVIYSNGLRIGKAIRSAPSVTAETATEAAATTSPAGATTAGVEIEKTGVYVVQITEH